MNTMMWKCSALITLPIAAISYCAKKGNLKNCIPSFEEANQNIRADVEENTYNEFNDYGNSFILKILDNYRILGLILKLDC